MKDTYEFIAGEHYADEYLADVKEEVIGLTIHHETMGEGTITDAFITPYTPENCDKLCITVSFGEVVKKYCVAIVLRFLDANDDSTQTLAMCDALFFDLSQANKKEKMKVILAEMEMKMLKEKAEREEKEKKDKEKNKGKKKEKKKKKSEEEEEDDIYAL